MEIALVIAVLLLIVVLALQVIQVRKRPGEFVDLSPIQARLEAIERAGERLERTLRDELGRSRDEEVTQARNLREEVSGSLNSLGDSLREQMRDISLGQKNQLDLFASQLVTLTHSNEEKLGQLREVIEERLHAFSDSLVQNMGDLNTTQRQQTEAVTSQLTAIRESIAEKHDAIRMAVDTRLQALQQENATKLEQMRQTVDEQLHGTLERRLGESFQLVSDRLEQVHKGLGEMQSLAAGVGDLKKVLSNVRVRGTWGEVQLGMLLSQMLTPDQYAENVATTGTEERVEFAIKLPGPDGDSSVWLPVDAKFPQEDYLRLIDAAERADLEAVETCSRQLEASIRASARELSQKYIAPPMTTDFGIMYLPTESLYAEVLRRSGLMESLQREYRVTIAGPTTLAALLNSLQMGFRTLAIQERSSEVWELLGAVRTEFAKYSEVLSKVQKKLQEASNAVDTGLVRTRAIERKLKDVEALPSTAGTELLISADAFDEAEPAAGEVTAGS